MMNLQFLKIHGITDYAHIKIIKLTRNNANNILPLRLVLIRSTVIGSGVPEKKHTHIKWLFLVEIQYTIHNLKNERLCHYVVFQPMHRKLPNNPGISM